ncbi:EthD domain-containing protein [Pseudohalioglobus lutimaris]|uniref:EthD domain-containing protein n=1 Tax=Pseudohalioglobus lutimaris TaxID=1737061 RepID=A0A2N5WX60_9GAMM|nr:EthD domain-containing protein [Pseudohalioglobus lutimaris]PLW66829.1 hypothetical protein C0039_19820 [Pseudohalioglobus lutimaris]
MRAQKKSDQSDENFYRYWLNEHGPLVASLSASLNIKRYAQSHTIQDALGQTSSAILAEDEARFIDLENSTIFFTEEHCVVDL